MRRFLFSLLSVVIAASLSFAHFIYVVPAKDGKTVAVVFSDSLGGDENVPIEKISGLKLTGRTAGKDAPLELKAGKTELSGTFAGQLAFGKHVYGISKTNDKPSLLVYHPKFVAAGVSAKDATLGEKTALEVVPHLEDGKIKFQLLAAGKPVAEADGSLLLDGEKKEKLKTDKDGFTASFEAKGRMAVWLRLVEAKPGEHDGKKYDETKHYATLVVDAK